MTVCLFCVQILTEQVCTQVVHKPHPEPDSTVKIQNPSKYTYNLSLGANDVVEVFRFKERKSGVAEKHLRVVQDMYLNIRKVSR